MKRFAKLVTNSLLLALLFGIIMLPSISSGILTVSNTKNGYVTPNVLSAESTRTKESTSEATSQDLPAIKQFIWVNETTETIETTETSETAKTMQGSPIKKPNLNKVVNNKPVK